MKTVLHVGDKFRYEVAEDNQPVPERHTVILSRFGNVLDLVRDDGTLLKINIKTTENQIPSNLVIEELSNRVAAYCCDGDYRFLVQDA